VNITETIQRAIAATREVIPDYFESTLVMHRQGSGKEQGSVFVGFGSDKELEDALVAAEWESYSHPDVMEGCEAFRAPIEGLLGTVDLAALPGDHVVILEDPKETGQVSAVVRGVPAEKVAFCAIILGLEQEKTVVFTVHPGDPVRPSQVPAQDLAGKTVTVKEALELGLPIGKFA